ncbi:MAG: hypothetical protein JSS27_04840 [Planctomycetes bacterium]|nr:hypothetical protein [Planctomycetota bacterium]
MHNGDLSIVSSTLSHSYRTLLARWDDTLDVWNDPVSKRFEEKHIEPLEPDVTGFLKAVNRLSQIMTKAVEECS